MTRTPLPTLLAAAVAAALGPGMAQAQAQQDKPDAASPNAVQEVVVTAEKRVTRLQETPVTVTALSEDALAAANVTSVASLQNVVPNILIGNPLGQSVVLAYIRGIGTANPVFSQDPAVSVYIDDVYLSRSLGANMDFFDIERVEVLRGPQGTLFGANSPAGAIRISTIKPDLLEGFSLRGQAIFGSFNERGVNLAANVPLVDNRVAARLVVQSGQRDGVQTNLADGSKAGTRDFTAVRLHLLGKIDDRWSVLLSANDFDNKSVPLSGVNFRDASGADLFLTPGYDKRNFASEMKVQYDNTQSRGLTLDVNGKLGWADFRSITARRTLGFQSRNDGDARTVSLFDNSQVLDNEQITQEFNLSGRSGAWRWLAGAYAIDEKSDFAWHVRVLASAVNPPFGVAPGFQVFDQHKKSWSVFTHQSYELSDQLTLSAALRWTAERKDFHVVGYTPTAVVDHGMPPGTPQPGFDLRQSKSWTAPQWRLAADYKFSRDAFGFASASRGFRSGGFNGGARSIAEASAPAFNPEFVTTYEAGVKTEWLARTLRLNATAFHSDYKDQQVAFLSNGVEFGTNTMNAKISGLELESVWQPARGVRLFANAASLHGSTDSSVNHFVPNAKYQYTVGLDLDGALSPTLNWFVGTSYFRTAAYDISAVLDPLRRVPAHGDLGARAGLASSDGKWKLELTGSNLLNDYWPVFSFNIPNLFTVRTPNQPRTFSLRLSFNH
jgi:iron complex outermembrane receptor protein